MISSKVNKTNLKRYIQETYERAARSLEVNTSPIITVSEKVKANEMILIGDYFHIFTHKQIQAMQSRIEKAKPIKKTTLRGPKKTILAKSKRKTASKPRKKAVRVRKFYCS